MQLILSLNYCSATPLWTTQLYCVGSFDFNLIAAWLFNTFKLTDFEVFIVEAHNG